MQLQVKVTQDCLNRGGISYNNCPICLGFINAGCDDVAVYPIFAAFIYDGGYYRAYLPPIATEFQNKWDIDDNISHFSPFEFTVELVPANRGQ